jgi:hypothetical protein
MTADIKVRELTTYSVANDGSLVVLRITDQAGNPVALTFSIDDLGMLAMTLPHAVH